MRGSVIAAPSRAGRCCSPYRSGAGPRDRPGFRAPAPLTMIFTLVIFGIVGVQGRDHRRDGQLLGQHARGMRVGKRRVGVHHRTAIAQQVDIAHVGACANRVRRSGLLVRSKQRPQNGPRLFAASPPVRRDSDLLAVQRRVRIGCDVKRHRSGRTAGRRSHRLLLLRPCAASSLVTFLCKCQAYRPSPGRHQQQHRQTSARCGGSPVHLRQLRTHGRDSGGDRLRYLFLVLRAGDIAHVQRRAERSPPRSPERQCCS